MKTVFVVCYAARQISLFACLPPPHRGGWEGLLLVCLSLNNLFDYFVSFGFAVSESNLADVDAFDRLVQLNAV